MTRLLVDRIAEAVLYEGYILYPYRPSVKNRQRWTFGGLYPEAYCQAKDSTSSSSNQTECLIHGNPETTFTATVRFLHLTDRVAGEITPPLTTWTENAVPSFRAVDSLRVGDRLLQSWQEAEEREVALDKVTLADLLAGPRATCFSFPGGRRLEPVFADTGDVPAMLVREQQSLQGQVEVSGTQVGEGLFRLTLRVLNRTPQPDAAGSTSEKALLFSLVSTHAILSVGQGEFVSLLDPPEGWRAAAATCRNVGVWPVLVGEQGQTDTMLSSPIILYDYPQVAPESPGNFFDGTEIDEMLTLRIMTLTDEEKRTMAAVDERAAALLARTEAMAGEQRLGLHGTVRTLRPLAAEQTHD